MKDKIEKILLYLGISPSQFADELGVQRSGISHILSERNKPSLEFIQKVLLKYKEINPEWLMMGKGEMLREAVQRSLFSQTTEQIIDNAVTDLKSNPVAHNIDDTKIKDLTTCTCVPEKSVSSDRTEADVKSISDNFIAEKGCEIEKIVLFYKDKTFSVYKPE